MSHGRHQHGVHDERSAGCWDGWWCTGWCSRWPWPWSPRLLDSVTVGNGVVGLLGASLLFGLVDALVGPVLRLLTLPLTLITLGLFTLVVNAILLFIASGLSNALSVGGFFATVWAALLISIVSTVLGWLVLPRH